MKDVVLITGANGHLAKVVSQYLCNDYNVRHLTTRKILASNDSYFHWDINQRYIDPKALENCKHIIHLAGFPILKRWTRKNKNIMYDSRINSANLILDTCKKMEIKPKTFISASAIGIYDQSIKGNIDEEATKGKDWISNMAVDWENAANRFKELGTRVIQMRISLIFSKKAGFLKYTLLSMKFGFGLILGNKNKKIRWIHTKDLARFIKESLNNKNYNGPYNLACQENTSQEDFIKAMQKNLFPYSIIVKIPVFIINLLLGERAQIINYSPSLNTKKLEEHGFKCKINNLEQIITDLE